MYENDPVIDEEAIQMSSEWKVAIDKELNAIKDLNESDLPPDRKDTIDIKWIFKTKQGGLKKHVSYLATNLSRFSTRFGINSEPSHLLSNSQNYNCTLCIILRNGYELRLLYVSTAFLNEQFETDVFDTTKSCRNS